MREGVLVTYVCAEPDIKRRAEEVNFYVGRKRSEILRLLFAMVKIRGTLCMRRHISVHRATAKYFSNSFVFKTKIEKEGLPRDSTPALGAPTSTLTAPSLTSNC